MKATIIFLSILFLNLTHNAQCVTGELLRNPSFESNSGCPVSVNGSLNSPNTPLMTVNDWLHGTGGSPDYYNCGQTLTSFGVPGYDAPSPYPNGTGYLAVLNYNAISFGTNISEYCAQCLTTPLISGQTYTFTFKLAGNQNCNQPPVQIGIWGTNLCSAINYSGTECPTVGGYNLLGLSSTISPNTNLWYTGSIVFTAPSSIAAVIVGINCTYPNPACGFYNYYYFDDFSLKGSDIPPSPTVSAGGNITCSVPNITLTATGGSTYSWTGAGIVSGAATANPVVNQAGIFNVTVTGANGCTTNTSVVVTQNTTPPSPTAGTSGNITCSVPNVTLTGTGGGTYSWSGGSIVSGATTASPVVNAGGTYNLTVTGANGCTANTSVVVNQNTTLPTVSTSPTTTNLNCTTLSTSLNGSASGGTSPYSYSWSPATGLSGTNVANPTANPSSSQTYVLTVTDDNGCQGTSNVTINVNNTPPTPSATGNDLSCAITSTTLVGSGGGTYSWSGPGIVSGGNTANPTINQPGIYNLTVTGANGCTAVAVVSVNQNTIIPSIALTTASTLSTTCASPNANLSATSNANPTTIYTWLTPLSTTLTGNPVNVSATGVYTVFVTNTTNGCNTATTPTTVQVVADANIPVVTLSSNSGTLTCSTITIGVTANTTASPVTYNWLPSAGIVSGANSATPVFNAAGNYSLTVTNTANSCASGGAANVVIITADNVNPIAGASASSSVLNCTTTSISLTGTGGGNYAWSGPGIVSGGTTANPIVNQAGIYTLVVTNPSNNCSSTNTTTLNITQNTNIPNILISSTGTISTTCANPTATLSASSSSDPNTIYQWLTPSSTTLTGNPVTASALGVYTLVVTDTNNGCSSSAIASSNNTVQIVPDSNVPTATLSTSNAQITCNNLTPSVVVNTTNTNLTFNWTPTTGIVSGATTNNPTFGASGSYSVVVTNTLNGCATGTGDYVVIVTTNTNAPVIGLSSVANTGTITCGNSNVLITPTITPSTDLTYTWSPSAGLSTNPNQADATIIAAGVYTLSVTNTLTGCMSVMDANSTFTVISNSNVPTATITAISTNSTINCGTGSFVTYSATVQSTNPINYNWLPNGDTTSTININSAGGYTLIVTDAITNCSVAVQYTVSGNSTIPNISANATAALLCSSGIITLNASSTNTNVSYVWQGPTPTSITSGNTTNNPVVNAVGIYTVTITDLSSNCFNTATVSVIQESITAAFSASPDNGIAPLSVDFTNQSVGAVSYNWFFGDGGLDSNTNPNHVYTNAGIYTVTLIASNGTCFSNATFIIIVNEDATIIIPNLFTPNADGKNELFFITNIDKYPNNTLEIYNRWGNLVYLKKGYNNTFDGKANQPSVGNGTLPSGTYFFTLDLGDGIPKNYKGYLELKY